MPEVRNQRLPEAEIGTVVGAWPTLALVVGTGLLGAALARREGTRASSRSGGISRKGGCRPGRSLRGLQCSWEVPFS